MSECRDCENPIETEALAVEGYCEDCNAAWERECAADEKDREFQFLAGQGVL